VLKFSNELGYGPKYALAYANNKFREKIAYQNIKKRTTFIILAPAFGNDNNNRIWWIKNRVNIKTKPVSTVNYDNGYKIEKYILSDEELKVPSDPNLINGLWFR
jgi:hypothetical protein